MAQRYPPATVDPANGFCSETKTFYSLRPPVFLPQPTQPLSLTDYILSLLPSSIPSFPYIIDSSSDHRLTYSQSLYLADSLAFHLTARFSLSKGDVAFILLPPSLNVPIIYLSLLALGVVVSPANPLSSESEISHQVRISNPSIAFATSSTASKLPKLRLGMVMVDSPEFESMLTQYSGAGVGVGVSVSSASSSSLLLRNVNRVHQSDPATILYSSGTAGRVKGVLMTHRNLISLIAGGSFRIQQKVDPDPAEPQPPSVSLIAMPPFHVYGFFMLIMGFVLGETLILMRKFGFEEMLRAIENYKVNRLPVSPPIIMALVKSELTDKYDLRSLRAAVCGGAPLSREVSERFKAKFAYVELLQVTRTVLTVTRMNLRDNIRNIRKGIFFIDIYIDIINLFCYSYSNFPLIVLPL